MTAIIVSGADSAFFRLMKGTFLSLKARTLPGGVSLGALDCGLAPGEVAWLESEGIAVVQPGWDIRQPDPEKVPSYQKAYFARPFLPKHFPGHDSYMWMDADTWVQDAAAVELYLDAAKDGAIAIAPEADRAYERHGHDLKWRTLFGVPVGATSFMYRRYRRAWGREAAMRLATRPVLNNGVFALRGDAPHWAAWADAYQRGQDNYPDALRRVLDQASLNYAIYEADLPRALLPAWCNWMVNLAAPLVDADSGELREPHPPYRRLGIVHLAHQTKDAPQWLATTAGDQTERTLLYRGGDY